MNLDVQYASVDEELPSPQDFEQWLNSLQRYCDPDSECVVRIVDREEMVDLNQKYRQKDGPTNVLSFPFEAPEGVHLPILGDLVICAPIVRQEAHVQGKSLTAHWAHLVIHGGLHLLGYDHMEPSQAEEMESLEIDLLRTHGIANPYQPEPH